MHLVFEDFARDLCNIAYAFFIFQSINNFRYVQCQLITNFHGTVELHYYNIFY